MDKQYALITGASKGIGKAIAECLASYGLNLVLVSLPDENLEAVASELGSRFNVEACYLEIDLSLHASPRILRTWCEARDLQINILINNAGIGYQGGFEQFESGFYEKLIQINVLAPAILTREFLPMLKRQKQSWILYSSSLAGFNPMPFKIVYAASKSFITQFSRGLYQELRGSGVHVSVLCPAGVDSFAASSARIEQWGWVGRSGRLTPAQVADKAVRGMFKKKRTIIPGKLNILFYYILKVLPTSIILRVAHSVLCKFHIATPESAVGYQLIAKKTSDKERQTDLVKNT